MIKVCLLICQSSTVLSLSPARYQIIEELKKRNCYVTVILKGELGENAIKNNIDKLVNMSERTNDAIRTEILNQCPNIVMCFTYEDTLICSLLPFIMKRTFFYYYNLEIYVYPSFENSNYNYLKRILYYFKYIYNKFHEVLFVSKCNALVIQDPLREKILKKHGISHKKVFYIPNSYYDKKEYNNIKNRQKKTLISTGGFYRESLESFLQQLPILDNIPITFSGWFSGNLLKRFYSELKKHPNIKIYKQQLSIEKYTEYIKPFGIAFIWYSDTKDDNVYNMGLASGKFFKHLSVGQPVIVINFPGIAQEVKKRKLGIVIKNVSELKKAVEEIINHYEFYSLNVKKAYKQYYDFEKVSKPFFDYILNI